MKKILCSLIALIVLLNITTNVNAAAYSNSITAYKSGEKLEYINGIEVYVNKSSSYYLYSLDNNTYFNTSTTLSSPVKVSDALSYIITNSNLTSDSNKNYYIAQVAVLWYEDYINNTNKNINQALKEYITNNTDNNTVCYYITKLVYNAVNLNNNTYIKFEDNDISFTKSGNYYYSNNIYVTANDLYSEPTVKLIGAPSSTSIVNKSLIKDGKGYLQLRIPINSYENFNDEVFEIRLTGKVTNNNLYKYNNSLNQVIYGRVYTSSTNTVDSVLPIYVDNNVYPEVRVKVLDKSGNNISNVRYDIYKGDCKNTTCNSTNYISYLNTSGVYNFFKNTFTKGTYTFVKKTDTNYDLNDKELIYVNDKDSIQTFTFKEKTVNNYKNLLITNSLNNSSIIIKIYNNDGTLLNSYRSSNTNYEINLNDGEYYINSSDNSIVVYFKIVDGELQVKINNKYYEKNNINLDDYLLRYSIEDEETTKDEEIYTDEDGTIHIGNLDGIDSIDISQNVETTTDVKIDWISNIIDCPPTSISSTLKYIIGASILGLGIYLIIRNVKKSKNNI